MVEPLDVALAELRPVLTDATSLVRAVASGRRRGHEAPGERRVELRPVDLKGRRRLLLEAWDGVQTTTSHVGPDEAAGVVEELLARPYANWHVETVDRTIQLRVTKRGEAQVHRATADRAQSTTHDRSPSRILPDDDPIFAVLRAGADKRRQVDAFLRLLDPVLPPTDQRPLAVVDLGCGNAALTFATYAHLRRQGRSAAVVGVDVKEQARSHNSEVARRLGWADSVTFVQDAIETVEQPLPTVDVVLALHACDTATDDALARAVQWQAPLVLAAPCCHHDLQRQIGRRAPDPYDALARDGILRERFADVLTDSLRADLLRLLGYRVDVVEFVASRHTPRNTMIRAVRTDAAPEAERVRRYRDLTAAWGVRPRLEELLAGLLGPVLAGP